MTIQAGVKVISDGNDAGIDLGSDPIVASGTLTTSGSIATSSSVLSSSATGGIGYSAGAGGVVTQLTDRTTGVAINTICGTITTDNDSLAAEATADFIVTNTTVAITDTIVLSMQSGSNGGGTLVNVSSVTNGTFKIRVHNGNVGAGTAETGAILINFAVIKAVAA